MVDLRDGIATNRRPRLSARDAALVEAGSERAENRGLIDGLAAALAQEVTDRGAGDVAEAAARAAAIVALAGDWLSVVLTEDAGLTGTTLSEVASLDVTDGTWLLQVYLLYEADVTTGLKWQLTFDGALYLKADGVLDQVAILVDDVQSIAGDTGVRLVHYGGLLVGSGTLAMNAAQTVALSTTTLRAGSALVLRRIG